MSIESFSDLNNTSQGSGDKLRMDADLLDRSNQIILAQYSGFPSVYHNLNGHNYSAGNSRASERDGRERNRNRNSDGKAGEQSTGRKFLPRASYGSDSPDFFSLSRPNHCLSKTESEAAPERSSSARSGNEKCSEAGKGSSSFEQDIQ